MPAEQAQPSAAAAVAPAASTSQPTPPPSQSIVPLRNILLNYIKQTHDTLHDLIDNELASESSEVARRRILATYLIDKQRETARILALVRWCSNTGDKLEKL